MKALLRDNETLLGISPLEFAAYLRMTGWKESKILHNSGSEWVYHDNDEAFEILLPSSRRFADYARRIEEALETLETVEQRSQLEIAADLMTTGADVIRFPANYHAAGDGSMMIDDGVNFISNIRELLLASACSVIKPKPIHSTRKPARAIDYLRNLRLGQTERGSFVFTIVSKVPPRLTAEQAGALFAPEEEPYEREVTKTLARALEAVNSASERAAVTGNIEHFQNAISSGVSANLCDALVGLGSSMDSTKGMCIRFTWSPMRPENSNIPRSITVMSDYLPVIREASRLLRETSPEIEAQIVGYIISLHRPAEPGNRQWVRVVDLASSRPRTITIELNEQDYALAISAHQQEKRIICNGEVVKNGRSFVLENPNGFSIMTE